MSDIRDRLLRDFHDKEYRHAYLESFLDSLISGQIRAMREEEGISQQDLAEKLGTAQSAISRIESPDYCAWKVSTLRKVAKALDRALIIKFVSFGDALGDIQGFGTGKLVRPSFEHDPTFHQPASDSGGSPSSTVVSFRLRDPARVAHSTGATGTSDQTMKWANHG